jgi:hypothetical protein
MLGAGPVSASKECPPALVGDAAVVPNSMEQGDINGGAHSFDDVVAHGERLFVAKFNTCDGQGRPETTGGGAARSVPTHDEDGNAVNAGIVTKTRSSAPDSDACAGCHAQPEAGGSGDFVTNVFVLAQGRDPITQSIRAEVTNDRNTLAMHGSGPIEMLAREMTAELQAAAAGLPAGWHTISSKGVDFEVESDGAGNVIATDGGIDHDLVVKPFHQAGKVISLREFSTNAMNHHFGMQAEERFDLNPAKGFDTDFDNDGVHRELTLGDQTAISIFQAQLSTPQQVKPKKGADRRSIDRGEGVFDDLGCTSCHVPELTISTTVFTEPNPFNPPGTCASSAGGCPDYSFDMATTGDGPRLEEGPNGEGIIRAYTDLKRHNLCDDPGPGAIRWFCNEQLAQGRPDDAIEGKPGTEYFLTRKLWDVGNTSPYGHRGDVTTIAEAILLHGGEGRASRDAYAAASDSDKTDLIKFLKSLRITGGDVDTGDVLDD